MLICIEGMDGVGKSTVSHTISDIFNVPMVEKPINKLLNLNREQSRKITHKIYESYSTHIQALYYLMGYLSVVEDSKKHDLIMDRGFLSTYYFSFHEENSFLFDTFIDNYGVPDITFVLYASISERIKRIRQRNAEDKDLNQSRLYDDDYDKFFEGLNRYNMPYFLINTEGLTEIETIGIVSRILTIVMSDRNKAPILTDLFSIENKSNIEKLSYAEIIDIIDKEICDKQILYKKVRRECNEKNCNK